MTANRHIKRSLAREASHAAVARLPVAPRLLMILVGLLALMLQSFVVQTHIHSSRGPGQLQTVSLASVVKGSVASTIGTSATAMTSRDKYPINEDPSNCPLCQEIAHSGQFVQSAAVLAALPASATIHFIPWTEAVIHSLTARHIWRSRAPPAPQS